MPIYEYQCLDCGEKIERLVPATRRGEPPACQRCHSPSVKRLISAFATLASSQNSEQTLLSGPTCTTGLCGL